MVDVCVSWKLMQLKTCASRKKEINPTQGLRANVFMCVTKSDVTKYTITMEINVPFLCVY